MGGPGVTHPDEDRFLRERLRSYRTPPCPQRVVDGILARVQAEEEAERSPAVSGGWLRALSSWRAHLLVPAATLALVVFLLVSSPGGPERGAVPPTPVVSAPSDSTDPCARELEAIFRRLGVDRSTLAYDDATICAAAQEIRLALTLVGRAVDSTEDVVGRQTRDRFSNAIRRGLGTGFDRFVKQDPASHQGG